MSDSTTELVPIATLLERRTQGAGTVQYVVTTDWMQGRTTFGGLTAALAARAMRDAANGEWPLRALQASFVGPVGGETSVEVRSLRKGKNMEQVQATVVSNGGTAAVVLAAFGKGRETLVPARLPKAPPVARSVDDSVEVPFVPGFTPNFLQHFRSRWSEGEFPSAHKESWHSRIWTRLRDPFDDLELQAIMLTDLPPTPVLSFFSQFPRASSVSWELELMPLPKSLDSAGWFRVDTDVAAAAEGYVSQRTTLWTPDGSVAAIGYQVVGVYG